MTAVDLIEDIKSRIIAELLPEVKSTVDEMYKERIRCATLSAEEAADYIGVSKMTFYTMVKEKQIPSFPVGSLNSQRPQIRVRLSTLDRWMEDREKNNSV